MASYSIRAVTLLFFLCLHLLVHSLPFHAMADFDAVLLTPEQQLQHQLQQMHMQNQQLIRELNHLRQAHLPRHISPSPPPLLPTRPNLNLPQPPDFSGNPLELKTFKIKLIHFLRGNFNTY